jgi:tetratricopeptide (TPR) repeat protein
MSSVRLSLLTIGSGIAVVAALSGPPARSKREHESPLLPRPELLRVLGNAQRHMLADYYWVLTTEATGRASSRHEYRDIADYAEIVSELDPKFRYIYVFAGVSVPYNLGRETWVNTEESTRILSKGFLLFPDYVYLRILLAYNLSYFHQRYKQAADVLRDTLELPRAPSYLSALATRLYAQAGAIDAGLSLAQSLFQNAPDPSTREAFERRTKELLLERELQRMDKAVEAFRKQKGRLPATALELISAGVIHEIPSDPLGGTIVIGSDGRSYSTVAENRRLEVFDASKLN